MLVRFICVVLVRFICVVMVRFICWFRYISWLTHTHALYNLTVVTMITNTSKTHLSTLFEDKEYNPEKSFIEFRNSSRPRIKDETNTVGIPIYLLFDNNVTKPFSDRPSSVDYESWERFNTELANKKIYVTHNGYKFRRYFRYIKGKFVLKSFGIKKIIDVRGIRCCFKTDRIILINTVEHGSIVLEAADIDDAILIESVINGATSDLKDMLPSE